MKTEYIVAIVVAVIVIVGGVLAFDYFTGDLGIINNKETSTFDNKFMSGVFVGNVSEVESNNTDNFSANYRDVEKRIDYNMSTSKNGSFLMDYLSIQSGSKIENRTIGDTKWQIMFSQGQGNIANNSTDGKNSTYDIYICQATENNQNYIIFIINEKVDGLAPTVESDGSLYCEFFTDYARPLLESVEFKHLEDAPEIYELLGISESDHNQLLEFMKQYRAGEIDINGNPTS